MAKLVDASVLEADPAKGEGSNPSGRTHLHRKLYR